MQANLWQQLAICDQANRPMPPVDLRCGDVLTELAQIPADSVDLIITSPPYNVGKAYGPDDPDARPWLDYYAWMQQVIHECQRVLRSGGVIAIVVPWIIRWQPFHPYAGTWQDYDPHYPARRQSTSVDGIGRVEPLGMRLCTMLADADLKLREPIMWVKGSDGMAMPEGTRVGCDSNPSLRSVHEAILLASKGTYHHRGGLGRYGQEAQPHLDWLKDVWHIPRAQSREHPAPFPLEIPRRLIALFTHAPDAVILDPFAGSGTTLIAAAQAGLPSIGIERQAAFVDLARRRLDQMVPRHVFGR